MELVSSNAVVVAKNFNPSILSQHWLITNGVVNDGEFLEGCIFVDGMSQVCTKRFHLMALADRVQLTTVDGSIPSLEPLSNVEEEMVIVEKIGKIVRALPHTPYTAIGLNFVWHQSASEEGLHELSYRLFFNKNRKIYDRFNDKSAHFGAYMSKDFEDGIRLKFDVKPIKRSDDAGESRVQFACNFHRDIVEPERGEQIIDTVGRWAHCKEHAKAITELALKGE